MSFLCLKELLKESICPGFLPVLFISSSPLNTTGLISDLQGWSSALLILMWSPWIEEKLWTLHSFTILVLREITVATDIEQKKWVSWAFPTILYLHFSWFLFFQYCLCIYVQLAAQQGSKSLLSLEKFLITARKGYNSPDKKTRQQPNFWNLQHCLELLKL